MLTCELPKAAPLPETGSSVGLDMGTTWFYVTSDGEFCENHRFFQASSKKLRVAQRALARKPNKRSNRRKKAKERVAKLYRRTARQRLQLHHEEAKKLVTAHDLICHEDLNVKGMAQGNLGKQIHDVGWGQFFQILASKAEWAGKRVEAPAFTPGVVHFCWSASIMVVMGKKTLTTMTPTTEPRTPIRTGSMVAVKLSTTLVTSSL